MTLINPSLLQATRISVSRKLKDAYDAVPADALWHTKLASEVPAKGGGINHYLTQRIPRLRRWTGARVVNNVKRIAQQILVADWEDTVGINVNDIKDDNLGSYDEIIEGLGRAGRMWPNDVVYEAITNGSTALCVDGQPYFNASHPLEVPGAASTQSNLHTSMALTAANFETVVTRMQNLKGEDNKPLGVGMGKLLLVVPPALRSTAKMILSSDQAGYLSNSSSTASDSNRNKGEADYLVIPDLTANSASTWYVIDPNLPLKPFLFVVQEKPDNVVSKDRPTDDNVFDLNEAVYGVSARGEYGYGMWQAAHKCTA